MKRTYRIHDLQPYINWAYFYHAWQLHDPVEQQKNRAEAEDILRHLDAKYQVYALFELFDCHSHGDDIVISLTANRSTLNFQLSTYPCCVSNMGIVSVSLTSFVLTTIRLGCLQPVSTMGWRPTSTRMLI